MYTCAYTFYIYICTYRYTHMYKLHIYKYISVCVCVCMYVWSYEWRVICFAFFKNENPANPCKSRISLIHWFCHCIVRPVWWGVHNNCQRGHRCLAFRGMPLPLWTLSNFAKLSCEQSWCNLLTWFDTFLGLRPWYWLHALVSYGPQLVQQSIRRCKRRQRAQ